MTIELTANRHGVSPPHDDEEEEYRWRSEMGGRLYRWQRQVRQQRYDGVYAGEPPDINARAYEVVEYIDLEAGRTFTKILEAIVGARDGLTAASRRFLLKKLRAVARDQRAYANRHEQLARRYEQFVALLEEPRAVDEGRQRDS